MTLGQLDRIVRTNGALYQRLRAACSEEHGLGSTHELDRHAAGITLVVSRARPLTRDHVPDLLQALDPQEKKPAASPRQRARRAPTKGSVTE